MGFGFIRYPRPSFATWKKGFKDNNDHKESFVIPDSSFRPHASLTPQKCGLAHL